MENKINIAELLKDCPKGMELNCTMFENTYFDYVDVENNLILCYSINDNIKTGLTFSKYGTYSTIKQSKCVIFPKGKTTWEGFVPPCKFKDGDIVVCGESRIDEYVSIFKTDKAIGTFYYHAMLTLYTIKPLFKTEDWALSVNIRLATEEEKEKLFDAIKANGYKWNEETKILEKLVEPKFKVGDRIRHKEKTKWVCTIARVEDRYYVDGHPMCFTLPFGKQNDYELVPNKFDINTLKPFDNCKFSLDGGITWKYAQYWFIQEKYNTKDIDIELWQG